MELLGFIFIIFIISSIGLDNILFTIIFGAILLFLFGFIINLINVIGIGGTLLGGALFILSIKIAIELKKNDVSLMIGILPLVFTFILGNQVINHYPKYSEKTYSFDAIANQDENFNLISKTKELDENNQFKIETTILKKDPKFSEGSIHYTQKNRGKIIIKGEFNARHEIINPEKAKISFYIPEKHKEKTDTFLKEYIDKLN